MADRYVKHTGSNTSPYDTWAKAATTLATAVTGSAAGDTIYVSSAHSVTGLASQTITGLGTSNNPLKIISVSDAAEPPVTVQAGASESTTLSGNYQISPFAYVEGIAISIGTLSNSPNIFLLGASGDQNTVYKSCTFALTSIGGGSRIRFQAAATSVTTRCSTTDCAFLLGNNTQQGIALGGDCTISGGTVSGPANYTTGVFQTPSQGRACFAAIDGVDMSGIGSASNLVSSLTAPMSVKISSSRLPAGWTGILFAGTRDAGQRVSMYNCDNADTNYRLWIEAYSGAIRDETTIVRTGGASDGDTPISWRMTTNASSNELTAPLRADPIASWCDTTGSSVTVTVEVMTDGVTMTDAEAWVDVEYLGTSGFPLSASISDKRATVLTTPANQTSSSETWTTTGLTTPVKQKLSVTFTPQEVGFIYATVRLAKPGTTMYVCPKLEVS